MLVTRILTAAALLAAFCAALFLLEGRQFAHVAALIVALGGYEWAKLSRLGGPWAWAYAMGCALAMELLFGIPGMDTAANGLAAIFWVLLVPIWLARGLAPASLPVLLPAGVLVLVPAGLAMASLGRAELLALFGIVWLADTAAYFTGRAFGRHKLAPNISPGKTWEGVFGGVVACIIYAIILTMLDPGMGARVTGMFWIPYLAGTVALCALSVLGDLFESALKRKAGVKDSGALLPGHGGVLDRIDSATVVLPVGALLLHWMRA